MKKSAILPAWGRILKGYRPFLSLEITKQCPLKCPGCYAYAPGHLNNGTDFASLSEWQGNELVDRVLNLVRRLRPLHVSIVGGEPLVRYREVTEILRQLETLGIEAQVVTSAVRLLPKEWRQFSNLHLVVSVDGLQSEHDLRRAPANYERIQQNIDGHQVIIHCTVVQQFIAKPGYLNEFVNYWSLRDNVRKIWFSLFTPQRGEFSDERLTPSSRMIAIDRIASLREPYPKLYAPGNLLDGYRHPPATPKECIFAQVTACLSADLTTPVTPCQIGGRPECRECGCIASAGFASIGKFKLAGLVRLSDIFAVSRRVGAHFRARKGG